MSTLQERYEQVKATLGRYEQAHLLSYYAELSDAQKETLLGQIEDQDWEEIGELIQEYVLQEPEVSLPDPIEPPPSYPHEPGSDLAPKYREARAKGEELLRAGKVAALTVAGGQGTRLGWDGPKGSFPATPVQGKPLFQVFAEYLRKAETKYDTTIAWYVMTSPINDQPTREFFAEHDHFGYNPDNIYFFSQGTMPSIGTDGKVLLESKNSLAQNPDGHGGSLKALYRSGALADMQQRGVTEISYFQVDNPNVKCVDPLFIGLHVLDGSEMSSKMLPKVNPHEKVGNFAVSDGDIYVIEYSDIPDELAEARNDDGKLKFNAGSIAIHMVGVDFVRKLNERGKRFALPFHRADKEVPHLDLESGEYVEPDEPNAVKLEMFIFDALPLADNSIILATERVEEFAPIKNAEGDDSPATSRELQSRRAAQWLEQQGVTVPFKDGELQAVIEISPLSAIAPEDLEGQKLPDRVEVGEEVVI